MGESVDGCLVAVVEMGDEKKGDAVGFRGEGGGDKKRVA